MFSIVLNEGFFLRNFSSQMQYWKRSTAQIINKLSLTMAGICPKKKNPALCTAFIFTKFGKYLDKNWLCQSALVSEFKNKCKKLSSGTGFKFLVMVQKVQAQL
jgi:hypothetical protein